MKTWVRKTLSVGVLAAGALLFAPGAAHADGHQSNGDNNGILNGTQLVAPISVPVNVVGNSLGILGEANSRGAGFNSTESGWTGQSNGDNNGILNGTQAYLPISVPLNVVGNSAALLGQAGATGVGVNRTESAHTTEGGWWGGGQSNWDNNGIANGTQVYAPVDVPINVCGNSLAVLGGAFSNAVCANNVESAKVTESGWQSNGDNNGILNGSQLYAPVNLPVNLAGNSLGLLGSANSRAVAVNESFHDDGFSSRHRHDDRFSQRNRHNNGFLNGTQFAAPISIPINVCGNSLGILGSAGSSALCANNVGRSFGGFGGFGSDFGGFGGGFGDDDAWIVGGHGLGWDHDYLGDDDYLGDNGVDDDDKGYGGTKPAGHKPAGNNGYGGTKPAGNKPAGNKPAGNKPAGNKPADNNGYGGTKPADNKGYGDTAPADNADDNKGYGDTAPADNADDKAYGDVKDDSKYASKDKPKAHKTAAKDPMNGGRRAATESLPISGLTDTVGGLGLLSTLR